MKLRVQLIKADGQTVVELVSHWTDARDDVHDGNLHEIYPELIENVIECLRSMCDEIENGTAYPRLKNSETGELRTLQEPNGFGMAWKAFIE